MPIHSPLSKAALCSGPSGLPPAPLPIGRRFFFFLQSTNLDAEHRGIEPSAQINTYAQNDIGIIPPRRFKIPKKAIVPHISIIKKITLKFRSKVGILSQLMPIFCSKT